MSSVDHVLAAVLAAAYPIYAMVAYRRIKPALVADVPGAREREYLMTIVELWLLCVVTVVVWTAAGRPWAALGFGLPGGWGLWIGTGLAAVAAAVLFNQLRWIRSDPAVREEVRRQLGAVDEYVPRTPRQHALFRGVAITAGFCEETIYRGYLMWYVTLLAGLVPAIIASSVAFGALHLNFGVEAAVRAGVVGLALAGLYWLTGSLWVPMALHAFIDLHAGWTARALRPPPAA